MARKKRSPHNRLAKGDVKQGQVHPTSPQLPLYHPTGRGSIPTELTIEQPLKLSEPFVYTVYFGTPGEALLWMKID